MLLHTNEFKIYPDGIAERLGLVNQVSIVILHTHINVKLF